MLFSNGESNLEVSCFLSSEDSGEQLISVTFCHVYPPTIYLIEAQ